jgi:glycerol kinase
LLLLLLQSDILQVPVQRPHFQETTALGAALAAGYTVGFWDMSFLTDHTPNEATTFLPDVTKEVAARRFKHWKKAVGRCLDLADLAT